MVNETSMNSQIQLNKLKKKIHPKLETLKTEITGPERKARKGIG